MLYIPNDILDQVNSLTAGIVADIATMGASSAGTFAGLSANLEGGFNAVNDKTDQLGDLFS